MAWPLRAVIVLLPVLSIAALTMYLWRKREEDEWSDMVRGLNLTERDVRVPLNTLAELIGRRGEGIEDLQERTNTKINFRDKVMHLDYVTCKITGKEENVIQAVDTIMEIINCQAELKTFDMWIPGTACGRVIGRCGDTVKSMAKISGARITVDSKAENSSLKKKVIIRGKVDQIQTAISLVEEKVREDEVARNKLYLTLSNRSPRGTAKSPNDLVAPKKPEYERLIATTGESSLQVYVSAITSPVHFWLQVITPRAADLDQLVDEMTDYYSKEENREPLSIEKISKGQILACLMMDGKWYRVEVYSVESHADPIEDTRIDVFYVDYGESEYVTLKTLSYLRTDFLALRFQAIEAQMVGVVPKEGEIWTDKANECFEDLTHCGQWRVLVAEIVGYKKRASDSYRVGSPLPCVRLYDPDGPPGIDIGQRLVEKNFAKSVPVEELTTQFELCNKDEEDDW